MKKSLIFAAAALTPLTLSAQNPAAASGGGLAAPPQATLAPATSPAVPRLPAVQFDNGQTLKEVIQTLHDHAKGAGLDPATDPLNIVISPGLEEASVPALSLRNVSPTEVLSVVTTVLNLHMEAVMGDDGNRIVAWLIKGQQAGADPFAVPHVASTPPPANPDPAAGSGAVIGGPAAPGFIPSATWAPSGGGGLTVPAPVAIAGSAPAGITSTPVPAPAVRVFGIAQLLSVNAANADEREKERAGKFERLIYTLNQLSNDQVIKTDIAAYREMDIIVVKCADRAGMELIAEAIEAMKSNVEPARAATSRPGGAAATGGGLRVN